MEGIPELLSSEKFPKELLELPNECLEEFRGLNESRILFIPLQHISEIPKGFPVRIVEETRERIPEGVRGRTSREIPE